MDRHDTLLIACGTPDNRKLLRSALSGRFNLLEAANTSQALLLLEQNLHCIATILIDITSPENLDMALLEEPKSHDLLSRLPVIIITQEDAPVQLNEIFSEGATDAIPLHYDPYAMLHRIENVVDLHLHKQNLEAMVQEQADKLRHSKQTMVDALSSIIEHRSAESGQHILRIRHFTQILLEEVRRSCPEYQLEERVIPIIASASAMHDIGKIAIPDAILMKPGPLTEQEREIMKTHAITGCQILDTVGDMGDPEYLRYAHNICHYHHERWDGGGYPEGLKGEQIPICAQVVGLADAYDALTSKRVYKDAYSFSKAVNMIFKGECGLFSPKLLECFKHVVGKFEALARAYADGLSPKSERFDVELPPPAEEKMDSVGRTKAKYNALVHYINGFLLEINLTQEIFHLVYNPYPEFAWLQEISTFGEMMEMVLENLIVPGEREQMREFMAKEIDAFVDEDLRRLTRHFHFRSPLYPQGQLFEMTLLRIMPENYNSRSLAILCRRLENQTVSQTPQTSATLLADSSFLCRNDADFTLIQLDSRITKLAGYTRQELREQFHNSLMALVLPEDRAALRHSFREQFNRGIDAEAEFRVRRKDGQVIWVLDKSRLSVAADGQEYMNSYLTDVTHTKRANDELRAKLSQYEIILAQTENVLFQWDIQLDRIEFSDTWEKIFGFRPMQENIRASLILTSNIHPDDLPLLLDGISRIENGSNYEMVEVRIATNRGRYLWCRFRASAIRDEDGQVTKIVGIIINIDAEKQAERQLQDRAERDALTKLLNKTAAQKQAEEYLRHYGQGAVCAMLIIDLDNFKQINDHYGHLFGDAVLTKAAREIEMLFRSQDIVARIGGDEFLVLMRGIADRTLLENRCKRLLQIFQNTFRRQKYKLPLSCSIGIALSPEHGTTYFELFQNADQALYEAKAKGKNNFCFYDRIGSVPSGTQIRNTPIDSDKEPGMADDNIVRFAVRKLYGSQEPEKAIQDVLALMGREMNISRVYIYENSADNQTCSNTYEWCNEGIEPLKEKQQNVRVQDYEKNFDETGIFYCPDAEVLPQQNYDILQGQDKKSILQCAIRENGTFRGCIGFNECRQQRFWTREQIEMLRYFSEMLSVFLLKHRQYEKLQAQLAALQADR